MTLYGVQMLLKDIDYLTGVHWHTVVVDEAHRLKSSTSQTYQAVAQVCCMCTVRPSAQLHRDYLLLLTGTPIQNNVRELYALLSLIDPARFDADAADPFVAKYSAVAKDAKCMLPTVHECTDW
jgi:SNF2 family DNA or RNA helicase